MHFIYVAVSFVYVNVMYLFDRLDAPSYLILQYLCLIF